MTKWKWMTPIANSRGLSMTDAGIEAAMRVQLEWGAFLDLDWSNRPCPKTAPSV